MTAYIPSRNNAFLLGLELLVAYFKAKENPLSSCLLSLELFAKIWYESVSIFLLFYFFIFIFLFLLLNITVQSHYQCHFFCRKKAFKSAPNIDTKCIKQSVFGILDFCSSVI